MDWYSSYQKKTTLNKTQNTIRDENVNSFINDIEYSFKDSLSYFQVTKYPENVTLYDVWITEVKDDEEKDGIQKKKIIMYPNQVLNYGDYINWQGEVWLTVDKSISPYYDNGNLQKVNDYLKFKANDSTIQNYPCVLSFLSRSYLDIQTDKELIIPKDLFVCKIQKNNYTQQIIESMRFILNGNAFKVVAKSDILVKNIIEIKLQSDLFRTGLDNVSSNGLADQSIQQTITPTTLAIQCSNSNNKIIINNSASFTIINNTNYTFIWSLQDAISGGVTSYASILSSTTATCIVKVGTIGGKQLKIIANCIEVPSTVLNLIFTISNGF